MEDLWETLQQVMQNEESMQMLSQMAQQMGLGDLSGLDPSSFEPTKEPSPSKDHTDRNAWSGDGFPFSPSMLLQLQRLWSQWGKEDDNTRLLRALKPHCSSPRQQRLEQAVQMMRLWALLPMLQESGLLGGKRSHDTADA